MKTKETYWLVARYVFLVLIGLFNLWIFYLLFTPLTVYSAFGILRLFDNGAKIFEGTLLFFSGQYAEIISACVAGAAYYLLLILNLTTPMKMETRIKSVAFVFVGFLVLNIIRIVVFMILFVKGYDYFSLAHQLVWYFGSTVLVVGIWFANVYLFKIKGIPIYSDMRNLFRDIERKR